LDTVGSHPAPVYVVWMARCVAPSADAHWMGLPLVVALTSSERGVDRRGMMHDGGGTTDRGGKRERPGCCVSLIMGLEWSDF
jgi:hypothetical protein